MQFPTKVGLSRKIKKASVFYVVKCNYSLTKKVTANTVAFSCSNGRRDSYKEIGTDAMNGLGI